MMLPSLRIALETLRVNPLRTTLSTLGIIMGVGSLVSVLALGDGMESYARLQASREGVQLVQLRARTADTLDGQAIPRRDTLRISIADVRSLSEHLGGQMPVTLSIEGSAVGVLGRSPAARGIRLSGVYTTRPESLHVELAHGRLLSTEEMERGESAAVVSTAVASAMGAAGEEDRAVGDSVRVGDRVLRVVGIMRARAASPVLSVLVPFQVAESLLIPGRGSLRLATVSAPRVEDAVTVRRAVERWLATRPATLRDGVTMSAHRPERLAEVSRGIRLFKLLMGAITGISLLVGGVGIMNVLLASVTERTREIGIRKAVGARRRDVLLQFLTESLTISGVGSAIGAAIGVGFAYAATAVMRAQTAAEIHAGFSVGTMLVAIIAASAVGLLFGIYPALRAARLSPIDAIRHE